jgi:putative oxidoreductase
MATAVDKQVSSNQDIALLIGRVFIGALFLIAAYNKAKGYGGVAGYFGRLGVPLPAVAAPLVIIFEAAAGILLIIGYQTRLVALLIALFVIVAALFAHMNFGDGNQLNHFLKNFAIAGGALALAVSGPGAHSMDAKR